MVTLEMVKANQKVKDFMDMGNTFLGNIGAIEHDLHHAQLTSQLARDILQALGYPDRIAELAAIAGYLHDIGNLVNRYGHGMSGALIAFQVLNEMGMETEEIAIIMGAIGNHEEHAKGCAVNHVAAALTLADKSDVNRSRVRKQDFATFTARDRVNYAVTDSRVIVQKEEQIITMQLQIDTSVCSVMEFFEIFLTKMMMCQHSAEYLGCEFKLVINDTRLL
ncbi:MAG TPA: HD domain-containing protein [Syntrophomonas sp.]|nr:HD domain-containing protein [Syntrophomonas sp.]HRW12708.1 HD domain-containing protein [Syntrophomonas sp.]